MRKILFVASECVPFIKTGGLADVASGIVTAIVLALVAALISKPKSKKQ